MRKTLRWRILIEIPAQIFYPSEKLCKSKKQNNSMRENRFEKIRFSKIFISTNFR